MKIVKFLIVTICFYCYLMLTGCSIGYGLLSSSTLENKSSSSSELEYKAEPLEEKIDQSIEALPKIEVYEPDGKKQFEVSLMEKDQILDKIEEKNEEITDEYDDEKLFDMPQSEDEQIDGDGLLSISPDYKKDLLTPIEAPEQADEIEIQEQASEEIIIPSTPKKIEKKEDYKVLVNCNSLNIRKNPNIDSALIGKANKNCLLSVLEQKGRWYKIESNNGLKGWVSAKYTITPTTAKYWKLFKSVIVKTPMLNVRKFYGSNEKVLFKLYKGDRVNVISKRVEVIKHKGKRLRRGWLQIETKEGEKGWVAGWNTIPVL